MQRFVRLLLALWMLGSLASSSPAQIQLKRSGEMQREARLIPPPREMQQHLDKAERALAERRYDEVFLHLEQLLQLEVADYMITDRTPPVSLKTAALEFVDRLDEPAREAFQLRYASEAASLLEQAIEARDVDQMQRISRRFIATEPGAEATLLLARMFLDRGMPLMAARRLERLSRHERLARQLDPERSLLLACCWYRAGVIDRAREVLLQLDRSATPGPLRFGGQEIPWFEAPQLDGWMQQWLRPAAVNVESLATDADESAAPMPQADPAWLARSGEGWQDQELLAALQDQYHQSDTPAIPVLRPMAAGSWIVVRSPHRLFGLHADSGKRSWSYPPRPDESAFDKLITNLGDQGRFLTEAGQTLLMRTWSDQAYAGVTTDQQRLYLVDDLSRLDFMTAMNAAAMGRSVPDIPMQNRLVALEIAREGALSWMRGGDDDPDEQMREMFFLGSPAVFGDRLYVLVEEKQQIVLLELDAASGEVLWKQTLLHLENSRIAVDPLRRLEGVRFTRQGDMLLCSTAADYVFGIDLADHRLAWTFQMQGSKVETKQGEIQFQPPTPRHNVYYPNSSMQQWQQVVDQLVPGDRWVETALLSDGSRILITPRYEDRFYCLDVYTGEPLWDLGRGDFLYAGCIHDQAVLMVGKYRLAKLRLSDGQPVWSENPFVALPSTGHPSGRGVALDQYYFLPTFSNDLIRINLQNGRTRRFSTSTMLGNLAVHNHMLVSQGPTETTLIPVTYQQDGSPTVDQPAAEPAGGEDPKDLVRQLGADRFQDREAAERKLAEMGNSAIDVVQQGLSSTDPEVRVRCRRIMDQIQFQLRERQLADFRDGNNDQLPGWQRFQKLVGDGEAARNLYAEMYEQEYPMLNALHDQSQDLMRRMNSRYQELQQAMSLHRYPLPLSTSATILFLVAEGQGEQNPALESFASTACYQNEFQQAMQQDPQKTVLTSMLVAWMQRATEKQNYQLVTLGLRYELKACLPMSRHWIKNRPKGDRNAYPVLAVAKFGSVTEDGELLETLLDDEQECSRYRTNNVEFVTQIRDVALAGLYHLHGKDPKDHGFERIESNTTYLYSMHTLGFSEDEQRTQVFEQWKQFKATLAAADSPSKEGDDEQAPADTPRGGS